MPKLYRAIYCSRNLIAGVEAAFAREVERILAVSRRNNARDELSGALMFSHGTFAQVLEGALDDIEMTLARIERDPRHDQFQLLELGPVTARAFTSWGMLFANPGIGNDRRAGEAIARAIRADPEGGEGLLAFLRQAV